MSAGDPAIETNWKLQFDSNRGGDVVLMPEVVLSRPPSREWNWSVCDLIAGLETMICFDRLLRPMD